MNKHKLLRGNSILTLIVLFGVLTFAWGSRPAAAEGDQTRDYALYLPVTYGQACIPRSLIMPNDSEKDLALENGINQVRANHGLPGLTHSDKIAQAALRHSNDMAHNGFVDTIGSDGSDPGDRLNDTCYQWQVLGEAIAGGYRTPAAAIAAWMEIPESKNAILSNSFTEFGAAYSFKRSSVYKHHYTVVFGLRKTALNTAQGKYYNCSYSIKDEDGGIWLNINSQLPCDQVFDSASGIDKLK